MNKLCLFFKKGKSIISKYVLYIYYKTKYSKHDGREIIKLIKWRVVDVAFSVTITFVCCLWEVTGNKSYNFISSCLLNRGRNVENM